MNKSLSKRGVILFSFLLGGAFGFFVQPHVSQLLWSQADAPHPEPLRESAQNYSFINPLLACNFSLAKEYRGFHDLREKIAKKIQSEKSRNALSNASIFLQDLSTNRWMGVNEDVRYTPASLMKAYLMIAYAKRADHDPHILSQKVKFTFDKGINAIQAEPVRNTLIFGKTYAIQDLIDVMIRESDNSVVDFLGSQIGDLAFQDVLSDLGVTSIKALSRI